MALSDLIRYLEEQARDHNMQDRSAWATLYPLGGKRGYNVTYGDLREALKILKAVEAGETQ